jgi:hypothetical protein
MLAIFFLFVVLPSIWVIGPALMAWVASFYIFGHCEGRDVFELYATNLVIGVGAMWLAVMFVPLLSILGAPSPWFFVPLAALGAALGTASGQRMTRPFTPRTLG